VRLPVLVATALGGAALLGTVLTAAPAAAAQIPTRPVPEVGITGDGMVAGYFISGNLVGEITSVSARWTEPTVTCTGDLRDTLGLVISIDAWTGSGDNFETVGAGDNCFTTAVHPDHHSTGAFAVVGTLAPPKGAAGYGVSIRTGDAMFESVARTGTSCTTTITDTTQNWSVTKNTPIVDSNAPNVRVFYGDTAGTTPDYSPVTVTDLEVNGAPVDPGTAFARGTTESDGVTDQVGPLVDGSFTVTRVQG
jgi:hypothetical protein